MVFSVFLSCKGCVSGICFSVPVCTTIKRQAHDERYLQHSNLFWFLTWKTKQGLNVLFHSLVMVCYTGVSMLYRDCCWNGLALGSYTHIHIHAGRQTYTLHRHAIQIYMIYTVIFNSISIHVTVSNLSPIRLHNPSCLHVPEKETGRKKVDKWGNWKQTVAADHVECTQLSVL